MTTEYEKARSHAQLMISFAHEEHPEEDMGELIREQVATVLEIYPSLKGKIDIGMLIKELETIFSTWIGEAVTLEGKDNHEAWLPNKRGDIEWRYWRRYKDYLKRRGWAQSTVEKIDEMTEDILGRLEDPTRKGAWDRRGLIVGHVQSGKTSNYIGLINKAADSGYKVIIVLTGMHDSLRCQTQTRLDEGFLGYDSGTRTLDSSKAVQRIGVGLIDPGVKPLDTITTRLENGDFRRSVANHFNINPGGNPLLFVLKKNGRVLNNLLEWVEWATTNTDENGRKSVNAVPLLLIDDEADWGSIDTKDDVIGEDGSPDLDHSPSVLNSRIRKLLFSFEQSAYVGYTATPFANIFIHDQGKTNDLGEDLFPRSFITNLPIPSNYLGPARFFGISEDEEDEALEELPLYREVDDYADTDELNEGNGWMPPVHNSSHTPLVNGISRIPDSLREAILSFILVCAARRARGQTEVHNSMLIHVTKFVNVQEKVYDQVYAELHDIQNRIKWENGNSEAGIISTLNDLWISDFVPTTSDMGGIEERYMEWPLIKENLIQAATSIVIKQINGSSRDVLDYYQNSGGGLNVIVIGGDKLSRGLTLEGLSVSYFLRASKMYDTLMQMGRWFGYHPGYIDLCRLFTTHEIKNWLYEISKASEQLRREFDYMVSIGATPIDYGLKVQTIAQLLITSRVKMRHGKPIQISFSGDISETITFYKDLEKNKQNLKALDNLFERMTLDNIRPETDPHRNRLEGRSQNWKGGYCWSGVPAKHIKQFLNEYNSHFSNYKVDCKLMGAYIEKQNEDDDLTDWTVLLPSGGSNEEIDVKNVGKVQLVNRSWNPTMEISKSEHLFIKRLVSPRDETIDLTDEEYKNALERTIAGWEMNKEKSRRKKPPKEPSGISIRNTRSKTKGLLLIYLLSPPEYMGFDKTPVASFAMSFPGNAHARTVSYIVNNVYYKQEMGLA